MRRAGTVNAAVRYTAPECNGCFDRHAMALAIEALADGQSVSFPALRFVGGPADPPPIVITRSASAYREA
jgi:hypothetical protein